MLGPMEVKVEVSDTNFDVEKIYLKIINYKWNYIRKYNFIKKTLTVIETLVYKILVDFCYKS